MLFRSILVGDGSDNIDAGNGNNIVYAGAGYNTVKTGTGSDRIDLTGGVVDAGAGDDQIAFHFISSGWHAVNGGEGDDSLSLDVYSSNRISLGWYSEQQVQYNLRSYFQR